MKLANYNSTLSCFSKCIRIIDTMVNKKIIFGLFILCFLGACAGPTAMLGPAYTITSSGNILQAGLSYGSSEIITNYTGKTPLENLEGITKKKFKNKKNIKKQTLESDDFHLMVMNKFKKTRNLISLSSQ
jgi:hypothetical protein